MITSNATLLRRMTVFASRALTLQALSKFARQETVTACTHYGILHTPFFSQTMQTRTILGIPT